MSIERKIPSGYGLDTERENQIPSKERQNPESRPSPFQKALAEARLALTSHEQILKGAGVTDEIFTKALLIAEKQVTTEWERREQISPLMLISEALDSIAETDDERVIVDGAKKRIEEFKQHWIDLLDKIGGLDTPDDTIEQKIKKRFIDNKGPKSDTFTYWRRHHEIQYKKSEEHQMGLLLLNPEKSAADTLVFPGILKEKFLKETGGLEKGKSYADLINPSTINEGKGIISDPTYYNGTAFQIPCEKIPGVRADLYLGPDDPGSYKKVGAMDGLIIYLNLDAFKKALHKD